MKILVCHLKAHIVGLRVPMAGVSNAKHINTSQSFKASKILDY